MPPNSASHAFLLLHQRLPVWAKPSTAMAPSSQLRPTHLPALSRDSPQPYQPSLSASWLFQRSMSLRIGQAKAKAGPRGRVAKGAWLPPNHINRLMSCNFACMQVMLPLPDLYSATAAACSGWHPVCAAELRCTQHACRAGCLGHVLPSSAWDWVHRQTHIGQHQPAHCCGGVHSSV